MSDQRYSDDELRAREIPSFIEPRPPLITHPALRPRPQKGTNLLDLFEEDTESEECELLQVYLRLKPCKEVNDLYEVRSDKCFITSMDTTTAGHGRRTQHNVSKMYTFSQIFGPESTQKEIFESVVKDNLKKLPEGQSFTLLTYGASGSGKTYTLMGTVGSPGLVPRSLEYVFKLIDASQQPTYKPAEGGGHKLSYAEQEYEMQWVRKLRQVSAPLRDNYRRMSTHLNGYLSESSNNLTYKKRHYVWVSFVEIYNEAIYDLLAPPDKRTKLRIREDSSGNVFVKDASQAFVRSGEEAYDIMVAGKHNLVVASTGIHAQSSRSHCIFTITMLTESESGIRSSCVRLCDLAGCERARATRNTGARMAESRAINTSLHVLERCLHALHRLQRLRQRAAHRPDTLVVPYRESKLTRLLGGGLSGAEGEAVSMVVTLNPAMRYANETKHVLALAAVAQDIQVNNTMLTSTFGSNMTEVNTTVDTSSEVMKLRADNERLHYELALSHSRNDTLKASFDEYRQKTSKTMSEVVEETKKISQMYYEAQIKFLRDEMNDMREEYESRLTETVAPIGSTDMPQNNHLQSKVEELMNKIAVLEEELVAERLAKSQAENENEYLRTCIEEKDEIIYKYTENRNQDDVVILSDSEQESDDNDDTDDPLQESLEPMFKMANLNKTLQKTINEDIQESPYEDYIDHKYNNSIKAHGNVLSEDNAIGCAVNDNNTCKENCYPESGNIIQNMKTEIKDYLYGMECDEKLVQENEQFDVHTCISQPKENSNDEISTSCVIDDEKLKKVNPQRGSYCLATNTELPEDSFDVKLNEDFVSSTDNFSLDKIGMNYNKGLSVDKDRIHCNKPILELSEDSCDIKVKENIGYDMNNLGVHKNKINYNNMTIELIKDSYDVEEKENITDNVNSSTDNFSVDKGKIIHNEAALRIHENPFAMKLKENTEHSVVSSTVDKNVTEINNIQSTTLKNETETVLKKDCRNNSLSQFEQLEMAIKYRPDDNHKEEMNNIKSTTLKNETETEVKKDCRDSSLSQFEQLEMAIKSRPNDDHKEEMNNIKSTTLKKETETVVKKDCRDNSLNQFEQLEMLIKSRHNDDDKGKDDDFDEIKVRKGKKNYFDESINPSPNKITDKIKLFNKICKPLERKITKQDSNDFIKVKRTYFDNLDVNLKIDRKEGVTDTTSDNIVKEPDSTHTDLAHNFQPRINIKHFGEVETKPVKSFSAINKTAKINDSLDVFDEPESPNILNPTNTMSTVEVVEEPKNSKIHLLDTEHEIKPSNKPQPQREILNNTIDEFDNICKRTSSRVTEFDLLFANQTPATNNAIKNNDVENIEVNPVENYTQYELNTKYALRNRAVKGTVKRCLRLRRRKEQNEAETSEKEEVTLKDIGNLQQEFSDITIDVPSQRREVKDMSSPDNVIEEENLPPESGIQSCPAKSVTRSRRKLFTPQVEPLDESLGHTGDSNERIRVPRPSYRRRGKARRKL